MAVANKTPRFKADIRIKPEGKRAEPDKKARPCARTGCDGDGSYRVTRNRERLGEYI